MEINITQYPIVRVEHNNVSSMREFIAAFNDLLNRENSFVFVRVFQDINNEISPSHEMWKEAVLWVKENKPRIKLWVKGWIEIAPDQQNLPDMQQGLNRAQKFWNIDFYVVDNEAEARSKGLALLSQIASI